MFYTSALRPDVFLVFSDLPPPFSFNSKSISTQLYFLKLISVLAPQYTGDHMSSPAFTAAEIRRGELLPQQQHTTYYKLPILFQRFGVFLILDWVFVDAVERSIVWWWNVYMRNGLKIFAPYVFDDEITNSFRHFCTSWYGSSTYLYRMVGFFVK